jgi:3-oxoacyl-[acyl-carrier protein] reductase
MSSPEKTHRLTQIAKQVIGAPVASVPGRRFDGQVCVVTGAARGIGRAIAELFASEGARAICVLDIGDGAEAVASLKAVSPTVQAVAMKVDITKESDVSSTMSEIVKKFGKVDVLVQAAGITGQTNLKTHEVDTADFQRVFDLNVKAIFLCAKNVLPTMLKEGYGRIVNIASISGKDGNAGMLAYSSSKAAVINLTKVMGKDYASSGKDITINCVAPAVVQTAMVDAMPPEQVKYMTEKIPMGRTGSMKEVALTVAFAASSECSFTTGFCFDCSGGRAVY